MWHTLLVFDLELRAQWCFGDEQWKAGKLENGAALRGYYSDHLRGALVGYHSATSVSWLQLSDSG